MEPPPARTDGSAIDAAARQVVERGIVLRDPHRVPDVESEMLALHAPEGLGLRLADEDVEGALA